MFVKKRAIPRNLHIVRCVKYLKKSSDKVYTETYAYETTDIRRQEDKTWYEKHKRNTKAHYTDGKEVSIQKEQKIPICECMCTCGNCSIS